MKKAGFIDVVEDYGNGLTLETIIVKDLRDKNWSPEMFFRITSSGILEYNILRKKIKGV
jgi:hypothetical protein